MCTTERQSVFVRGRAEGFSLLEVLISFAILVVAFAAIPPLFIAATQANVVAGDTTWATTLAAQKLEELVAGSPLEATGGERTDYLDQSGASTDLTSAPRAFVRRWSVEPFPSTPDRTFVLSVAVSRYRGTDRALDSARMVTLRTRTAP